VTSPQRWDIFCSVVDNYGDAGVAWRLARQLVAEYRRDARLFVDALPVLARIAPDVDPSRERQKVQGVEILRWNGPDRPMAPTTPGAAVIEAFGCGLPSSYLDAMLALPAQPVWINLEYLSAESWIEGSHALASRHPRLPLQRHFYFPGFTAGSGGLLREAGLLPRRDAFQANPAARAGFWRSLGVAPGRRARYLTVLLSEPTSAGAARCVGRRRSASVVHRARRCRRGRDRSMDRRRRSACGTSSHPRPPVAGWYSFPPSRRL
jgi:uncharacterized repeat protein (TIGR03837 family)